MGTDQRVVDFGYNHCLKSNQTLLFLTTFAGEEHVKTNDYSSHKECSSGCHWGAKRQKPAK
jgi:hypothetical protein